MSRKYTSALGPRTRCVKFTNFAFLLCVALIVIVIGGKLYAEEVPNTSNACVDILVLFARGSSQNEESKFLDDPYKEKFLEEEREAGVFFQTFKAQLDREYPKVTYKAQSIHDFPNMGNGNGYKAVPAFSPPFTNPFQAEVTWLPVGDYKRSLEDGIDETAAYVKHQVAACPGQNIVLGGYSQGAQVIGESLFKLNATERSKVAGVALFGDPKFLASDFSSHAPWHKSETYPWKRGTAINRDTGMLEARVPYVPSDMTKKVFSWCFQDDFICSGVSGVRLNPAKFKETIGAGHSRYSIFGVQQAAKEIIQNMAPQLYALDKNRGGVDKTAGPVQPVPYRPNSKPIDFMFLVNYSGGMDDVIGQLRFSTPWVLPVFGSFFGDIKYGVGDFGERADMPNAPRINLRQNLAALQPGTDPTYQIHKTFISKLAYGTLSGGGGDAPDAHVLAIERMAMEPDWRDGAKKHLVLISDRPARTPYTYNMCNSLVRSGFGLDFNNCPTQPELETGQTQAHSEYCDSTLNVLLTSQCSLGLTKPTSTHNITRDLEDAISLANSKGIAVSVVVPHDFRPDVDKDYAKRQLEQLAKSTGGLYLSYDTFSQANYSDMMWQILNHDAPIMRLSSHDTVDTVNQWGEASPQPEGYLVVRDGVPTIVDASQSSQNFESYAWDFDGDNVVDERTDGPVVEHTFSLSDNGESIKLVGENANGQSGMINLPIQVLEYGGEKYDSFSVPSEPTDVKAILKDGKVEISWSNRSTDEIIFVSEVDTGMPVASAPAVEGNVVIPYEEYLGTTLQVWLMNESAASARMVVSISEPLPISTEVPKEKRGLGESNPWGQLLDIPEQVVERVLTVIEPSLQQPEITAEAQEPDVAPQVAAASDMAEAITTTTEEKTVSTPKPQFFDTTRDLQLFIIGVVGLIILVVLAFTIVL